MLVSPLKNNNLASSHKQKYLGGSFVIQEFVKPHYREETFRKAGLHEAGSAAAAAGHRPVKSIIC